MLGSAPSMVNITPGSSAAAAAFYWTASSSTITVTYLAAPAAGTDNVVLSWQVSV